MSAVHRTCDELGVCQGRGNCTCASEAPPEAGNVRFISNEPLEIMTTTDRIAVTVLLILSAAISIGTLHWLYQTLFTTH